MKLLIIHQAFASIDAPGGTRHFEFAQYLASTGHEVTIVASDVSYLTGERIARFGAMDDPPLTNRISIQRVHTPRTLHRNFAWRVFSFFGFMASSAVAGLRVGGVDVVMGTSPPIFQAVAAWAVAFLRRKPFLLEIRDLWPSFAIDMGVLRNRGLIWMSRGLENFLYARASHILVNSPAYADYLQQKGVTADRISLIPNGADPTMFDPDDHGSEFRRNHGLDDRFVVMYAGALGQANDIPTLLRAAARIKDSNLIRILLVGDGKERANLEHMADELQLTNVRFLGALAKRDVPRALAGADACVAILQPIPMFTMTYPNKVFDYMAAGKPVILAIDGVIRDAVETAGAGVFVPPGDDHALAGAIVELASNHERCRAMGKAGRAAVEEQFDRRAHAADFSRLITRMAKG